MPACTATRRTLAHGLQLGGDLLQRPIGCGGGQCGIHSCAGCDRIAIKDACYRDLRHDPGPTRPLAPDSRDLGRTTSRSGAESHPVFHLQAPDALELPDIGSDDDGTQ
jgi:hypothetical protein